VAVIAVDSKVEDEFGSETLIQLGQYTKLLSALIKSYNEKYELLLSSELLRSIRRMQERIRNNFTTATILQSLSEETSKLVNWDFLSIVLFDEHKRTWNAKKVANRGYEEGYIMTDQAIDFPHSIVGEAIRNTTHRIVDDLSQSALPRYMKDEKVTKEGSFISVPITSINKCYGALNLESREKLNFSRQDVETLYRLSENVASALEILFMQEVIHEYVIVDETTGVYAKKFFLQRMEEEMHRADENGSDLSMLLVTVDKATEVEGRFGKDGFERVMGSLAKAIRASVRPYEIVGRYDHNQFGIVLVDTPANDAYLWAEKIRKNVAAQIISLDGKSFSITISTGVCGVLEGMKKEELVGNVMTVLNKAAESGGNSVRVY
jgi:diguanylate cyclase (GGDEF)-like protein